MSVSYITHARTRKHTCSQVLANTKCTRHHTHTTAALAAASAAANACGPQGAATGCGFHELDLGSKPLSDTVLSAVAGLGFMATTPVQQATIPLLLNNKDVAVQACTGSGKTAAFLVPAFELLVRSESQWRPRDVGAIVIAPTRELAMQIMSVASIMATAVPDVRVIMLTGGADTTDSFAQFLEHGGNVVVSIAFLFVCV